MKKIFILLSFVLLLNLSFANEFSKTVEVEGVGAIIDKNHAKARDEALWDAQRKAVEKGIGVFLNSETLVENAELLQDNIYTKSNGYVKKYEIIKEKKDDFLYYIKIKATVKTSEIGNKLIEMGLVKKVGDPRIMIIIPERNLNKISHEVIAETQLINSFVKAGYRIVDPNQVKKIRNSEKIKKLNEGNISIAREIAQEFGADIIISGRASSSEKGEIYGMISCGATVNIRAIKADSGEIIFAESSNAASTDLSKEMAAKKAIRAAGLILAEGGIEPNGRKVEAILPKVAKALLEKPSVQVLISNIKNEDYLNLLKTLKAERTIKNVFPRNYSNKKARIDIDYDRTVEDLLKLLSSVKNLNFTVGSSSISKLEIKIISPIKLVLQNGKYSHFKILRARLQSIKGLNIISKKYNSKSSIIELSYKGDLFELVDLLSENFEVDDINDTSIILSVK